jgi:hypothetical protein
VRRKQWHTSAISQPALWFVSDFAISTRLLRSAARSSAARMLRVRVRMVGEPLIQLSSQRSAKPLPASKWPDTTSEIAACSSALGDAARSRR